MILYIAFLVLGFFAGYLYKAPITGRHHKVLSASILLLLFFMGVSIGKDPDIGTKLFRYGYTAFTISFLAILFSVAVVWVMARFFRSRQS